MALVIAGQIVPLAEADEDETFRGRVFIDDQGNIEQVTAGNAAAPAGFADAPILDVDDAFVLPGLIDLHNHIGYNALPLWAEPNRQAAFAHHDSWTQAPSYQGSITWPAGALVQAEPEALLAYVQLRALVGGTTAIQGWPMASRKHVQVLRNIDEERAGSTSDDLIYTSALTQTREGLAIKSNALKNGAGFIYHCAEGQVGSLAAREFRDAVAAGCLQDTFIGIHCNAITSSDWDHWSKQEAGAVAWSPFSNVWLYGTTTDITAAHKRKVKICLGSDWGPSGTKNVQGELKVAKLLSEAQGLGLSDRDLVAMVTTNPGDVLKRCWKKTIGRLRPGAFADLCVVRRKGNQSVWSQIVGSTEREIMLVVYGGVPRYGDAALMSKKGLGKSTTLSVRGKQRRFAIPNPENPDEPWTWKAIKGRLDAVRKDPVKALKKADGRRRAYAGPLDDAEAPLELVLDMPSGNFAFAGDVSKHAAKIKVPQLPSLVHDATFFKSIKGRGFHGGLLDRLRGFYL